MKKRSITRGRKAATTSIARKLGVKPNGTRGRKVDPAKVADEALPSGARRCPDDPA